VPGIGGNADAAEPAPDDWRELAASLTGTLVLPADPAYASARLGWNAHYDAAPRAVVQAATAHDVAVAVRFARDRGIRPIPRSGRHSFAGFSTGSGLIIDVAGLDEIAVRRDRERARIGPGVDNIGMYRGLGRHGLAIPGGTCPTVGIAGLAQGGGIGPFGREHGLALDRMTAAQIVTADGRLLRVDAANHADLFWAIRGGGGGNFGIVTSFEFAPVPAGGTWTQSTIVYPWRHAARLFAVYQDWIPALTPRCTPVFVVRNDTASGTAEPTVYLEIAYRGSRAAHDAAVREFSREAGVKPLSQSASTGTFYETEMADWCPGFSAEECADAEATAAGRLPRLGVGIRSNYIVDRWPQRAIEVVIEQLERRQRDPELQPPGISSSTLAGKLRIEPVDGAMRLPAPSATAYRHRDCTLLAQYQVRFPTDASQSLAQANLEWLDALYDATRPWLSGKAYVNYLSRHPSHSGSAFYGANLARLRRIKATYDPTGLFRFGQGITPAA
jgi:FAD/FMN-containing dehydrogenase